MIKKMFMEKYVVFFFFKMDSLFTSIFDRHNYTNYKVKKLIDAPRHSLKISIGFKFCGERDYKDTYSPVCGVQEGGGGGGGISSKGATASGRDNVELPPAVTLGPILSY